MTKRFMRWRSPFEYDPWPELVLIPAHITDPTESDIVATIDVREGAILPVGDGLQPGTEYVWWTHTRIPQIPTSPLLPGVSETRYNGDALAELISKDRDEIDLWRERLYYGDPWAPTRLTSALRAYVTHAFFADCLHTENLPFDQALAAWEERRAELLAGVEQVI